MPQTYSDSGEMVSGFTADESSSPCPLGAQSKLTDNHHHKHHHHHHHRHTSHASRHNHCGTSQRPPEEDVRSALLQPASSAATHIIAEDPSMVSAKVVLPGRPEEGGQQSSEIAVVEHQQASRYRHHRHALPHSHRQQDPVPDLPSNEILPSSGSEEPADADGVMGVQAHEEAPGSSRGEEELGSEASPPVQQHFHRHPAHHHQHTHRRQLNHHDVEVTHRSSSGERHRLLQDQQRQQNFRANPFNSGLWISIELGFLLTQIVSAIVILPLSIYEQPKDPLGFWVTGYAAGCAALLPLLYWRYSQWCARDAGGSSGSGPAEMPTSEAGDERNSAGPRGDDAEALLELDHSHPTTAAERAVLGVDIEAGLTPRGSRSARRVLCFDMDDPRLPVLIAKYKAALDCFFAMWYVLGSMWVLGGTTTFQDAPLLYSLSLVYVVLSSISYGVPFLLCATICCCLPCIIAVMGSEDLDPARPQGTGLGPGNSKGAAPEAIAALPTFVFRTAGSRRKDEKHAENEGEEETLDDLESGGGKSEEVLEKGPCEGKTVAPSVSSESTGSQARAAGLGGGLLGAFTRAKWLQGFRGRRVSGLVVENQEKVRGSCVEGGDSDDDADSVGSGEEGLLCSGPVEEQRLAGGDAVCCICLAHYKDGAELRKLPCQHHFHASCVDTWLVINGCCPLCKEPIVPSEKEGPSS